MRVETELTWDHLAPGDLFRWEADGDLWTAVEVRSTAIIAQPWRPPEWSEDDRRPPALYQLHPDRRVWKVTVDG